MCIRDSPYTLVCMVSIAKAVAVETPSMEAIVNLAGALKGENYLHIGRTLKKVGWDGMSVEEIKNYLLNGKE